MTAPTPAESAYRAAVSAAVFVGVSYAVSGGAATMNVYAMEAGLQAASALASDFLHFQVAMLDNNLTSAMVTGAIATGFKWVARGDRNALANFAGAAGVDFASNLAISAAMGQDSAAF